MANFFLEIVNMSIMASYLIVAVIVLRLVLTKAPKWIRGILWGLVGIRLVVPFSFESMFSLLPGKSPIPADTLQSTATGTDVGTPPVMPDFSTSAGAAPQSTDVAGTFAPVEETLQTGGVFWTDILAIVWLVGMIVMLAYCIISYLRLKRRMADAVIYNGGLCVDGCKEDASEKRRKKCAIYQSEKVTSPFVLGFFKPRIYVPFQMTEKDMECVIAHEKAHIARKDHWIKPIAFILLSFYWFNPLVWVAYILLCRDIELACDEKVIKEMGENHKKAYSEALLKCSAPGRMISACPLAFGEVGVKKRIVNVLNYKKPAFWIILVSLLLCVVVAVCFMTKPKTEGEKNSPVEESSQAETESEQMPAEQATSEPSLFDDMPVVGILKEPPTLTMQDALSSAINFTYVESGTYGWTYPTGNPDEMITIEACGAFPTVAVKGKEDEWIEVRDYNGIDYAPYMLSWGIDPDRIRVVEYDLLDLGDMEPLVLDEYTLENVYFLELRPRRIYEVIAQWDEGSNGNGFYGEASYIFATDNYAVGSTVAEGEEQPVLIQATIKEVMADAKDKICITSETENYPGAFVVQIPEDVYPIDELKGGQQIVISMWDTGKMYDEHLPLYTALILRVHYPDAGTLTEEGDAMTGMDLPAVVDTPWTAEVNTLEGVTLSMEKYTDTNGDLEINNLLRLNYQSSDDVGKILQTGAWFTIQREIDGVWYDLAPIAEVAWEEIAYNVPAGETTVLPVTWEYLYGELPAGEYRIVISIQDWRAPGDFDAYYLADEFEIMKSY